MAWGWGGVGGGEYVSMDMRKNEEKKEIQSW